MKSPPPVPQRRLRFSCVVADPPWDQNQDAAAGLKLPEERHQAGIGASTSYRRMTVEEIEALPVRDVVADNAHLFLWVTNGAIVAPDSPIQRVCRAWGFRPVTVVTWAKHKKGEPSAPSMKVGTYFRGATEHVVFAVRGSLRLQHQDRRGIATWFGAERTMHSIKPDKFYDLVEEVSLGPRLDLFARVSRPGWVAVGDQVVGQEGIDVTVMLKRFAP